MFNIILIYLIRTFRYKLCICSIIFTNISFLYNTEFNTFLYNFLIIYGLFTYYHL